MARRRDEPKVRQPVDATVLERYRADRYQPGWVAGGWPASHWTAAGFTAWLQDRAAYRQNGGELPAMWALDRSFVSHNRDALPEQLLLDECLRPHSHPIESDAPSGG